MARSGIGVLICGAALAVCCGASEPGPKGEAKRDRKAAKEAQAGKDKRLEMDEDEAKSFQKMLERVPPDRREQFLRNFEAWIQLPDSERDFLRQREEARRKERRRQAESAMREAGLDLQGEQRTRFFERFGQERRRIEEALRKETEEKRCRMIEESLARLKEEFSAKPDDPQKPEPAPEPATGGDGDPR